MVYKNYLLILLLIILAFNYVDRLALGLVLQDIKLELRLSDTELGLLSGIAFALFYSVMGIPIARWADRGNRVAIISLTAGLWSVMVALCGAATSFAQLLITRIGVAIGEAGCVPPAHSLIADYFDRNERPRAVAIYMLGGPISMVIGFFLAGWVNELYGWRATFFMLGVPGLILSAVAWFTLKEPRGVASAVRQSTTVSTTAEFSFKEVFVALWNIATFRHLLWSFAVICFFSYGIFQWQPAFFIRSYGLKTGELGTWLTLIYGVGGMIGTYVGGEWAVRRAVNDECWQLKAMAAAIVGFGLLSMVIYLSPSRYVAFAILGLASVGVNMINGPLFAAIQTLVPDRMRATSIALIYLFANLIGMGLGPLATGAMSDAFRPWFGDESLRYALLALCPGYFWGGWHLWQASRSVTQDVAAVNPRNPTANAHVATP